MLCVWEKGKIINNEGPKFRVLTLESHLEFILQHSLRVLIQQELNGNFTEKGVSAGVQDSEETVWK